MYALHARFLHVWRPILYAQSVLINIISASELSRKFIKIALLVGLSLFLWGWGGVGLSQSPGVRSCRSSHDPSEETMMEVAELKPFTMLSAHLIRTATTIPL